MAETQLATIAKFGSPQTGPQGGTKPGPPGCSGFGQACHKLGSGSPQVSSPTPQVEAATPQVQRRKWKLLMSRFRRRIPCNSSSAVVMISKRLLTALNLTHMITTSVFRHLGARSAKGLASASPRQNRSAGRTGAQAATYQDITTNLLATS